MNSVAEREPRRWGPTTSTALEGLSSAFDKSLGLVSSPIVKAIAAYNRSRLPPCDAPHAMLTGVNQPMDRELTITDLEVKGAIPAELSGRYVRIGPNAIRPDPRTYHFFTGDGMLHAVALRDGRARWYRNRWIRSTEVARALGVAPAPGPRHVFDTVNTSVMQHAGDGWAMVEAGSTPVRFNEHLEQQRFDDFGGTLPGSFTAHPRRDPATGKLHAICYEAVDPKRVRYNVIEPDGRVSQSVTIRVTHGPLIHDCALTARYVVILDLPLTLSMQVVLAGHGFPYRWNDGHKARIGLLSREDPTGDVRWIDIDPCFVFHIANAYDLPDGRLTVDLIPYDRKHEGEDVGIEDTPRGLERWTVDPATGGVDRRVLDATPQELPVINQDRTGLPYRYAYALGLKGDPSSPEGFLIKHDLERATQAHHHFGDGRTAGEFVFVPARSASSEDEGWLMGFVIDDGGNSTSLEILNAQDIEAPPIASVRLPHRIPPGIHGAWMPDLPVEET